MCSKKLNIGSKDIINSLPEALIYHILSFLSTKEAALTSLLSRKWRYLFAFVPNLDFDDPVRMKPDMANQEETEIHTSFMDFVDRVLALRGNFPVSKFSLKCGNGVDDVGAKRWILNMLELGVSDLDLRLPLDRNYLFPLKVFVSKSLVKLRIGARNGLAVGGLIMKVGDVSLPKLKTLCLDSVVLDYQIICLAKLLSGCHVLEELDLVNLSSNFWESCSVSIPTLKRLTCCIEEDWINPPPSVTFDNPALVYFEYTDTVALKYEKVNFDSLVEARLGLRVAYEETENPIEFPDGIPFPVIEYVTVGDATDLLMG